MPTGTGSAFGLRIRSSFPLPELRPSRGLPDVGVSLGVAPPPAGGVEVFGHVAAPGAVCLRFPEVGAFLVTPDEIVAEPEPGLDDAVLRNFVLGPAIGTLLHLRGHLVLHASCVAFGERAAGVLGDSEHGKSTTAAACVLVGGALLVADDVVVVDLPAGGGAAAVPAFPRIKCWPESLRALGRDPDAYERVHPTLDKRDVRVPEAFASGPVSLEALYILVDGDEPAVSALDPQAAFAAVITNSYAADLLEVTGTRERHFEQVVSLLARLPARALATGAALADVPHVPAVIGADLAGA